MSLSSISNINSLLFSDKIGIIKSSSSENALFCGDNFKNSLIYTQNEANSSGTDVKKTSNTETTENNSYSKKVNENIRDTLIALTHEDTLISGLPEDIQNLLSDMPIIGRDGRINSNLMVLKSLIEMQKLNTDIAFDFKNLKMLLSIGSLMQAFKITSFDVSLAVLMSSNQNQNQSSLMPYALYLYIIGMNLIMKIRKEKVFNYK